MGLVRLVRLVRAAGVRDPANKRLLQGKTKTTFITRVTIISSFWSIDGRLTSHDHNRLSPGHFPSVTNRLSLDLCVGVCLRGCCV